MAKKSLQKKLQLKRNFTISRKKLRNNRQRKNRCPPFPKIGKEYRQNEKGHEELKRRIK